MTKPQTWASSEVAPGIPHFDTAPFNWYVVEQDSRLTLVDAGFPGHYRVFRKGIDSLGFSPKDVEAIVLTHAHADHIGFAERVRRESGAPVFVHKKDARMAQRPLQLPWLALLSNAWRPPVAKMLVIATTNGVFKCSRLKEVQAIEDGQTLDVPGRPVVHHTPGHTAGEIVLHFPQRRALISGDALVTRQLYSGEQGTPQLTPPALNSDFKQACESLRSLSSLGELTILSGHGTPWTGDIAEAVDIAISNAR